LFARRDSPTLRSMSELHILAQITAKPGREADVRRGIESLVAPTLAEPGCRQYVPYESNLPGKFFVDEIWDSQAALDAHMQTPHFLEIAARFPDLLDGPLVIEVLTKFD